MIFKRHRIPGMTLLPPFLSQSPATDISQSHFQFFHAKYFVSLINYDITEVRWVANTRVFVRFEPSQQLSASPAISKDCDCSLWVPQCDNLSVTFTCHRKDPWFVTFTPEAVTFLCTVGSSLDLVTWRSRARQSHLF